MEISKLQLNNLYYYLTPKGLIDYFITTEKFLVIDLETLDIILQDPIEYEIISLKFCLSNNKEIYQINLKKSIIKKIAKGEYLAVND